MSRKSQADRLAELTWWRERCEAQDERIMHLLGELTAMRQALIDVTAGPPFVEEMGSGRT